MKPLIISESGCGVSLKHDTVAIERLLKLLRVTFNEYKERYCFLSLCDKKWNESEAVRRAMLILLNAAYGLGSKKMILLGRRVARVFGSVLGTPIPLFSVWNGSSNSCKRFTYPVLDEVIIVSIPNPGGRCRMWTSPSTLEKARKVLKEASYLGW
jgi:hypothetical protein